MTSSLLPYVIFTHDYYEAKGGWNDFYARFATAEEAFMQIALDHWPIGPCPWKTVGPRVPYDYWEVINVITGETILP